MCFCVLVAYLDPGLQVLVMVLVIVLWAPVSNFGFRKIQMTTPGKDDREKLCFKAQGHAQGRHQAVRSKRRKPLMGKYGAPPASAFYMRVPRCCHPAIASQTPD